MTTKTRYFLIGAVAILVVGLGIGLVAYYGGVPNIAALGRTGPSELRYVPKNAAVVAYADVRSVMGSEFRQKIHAIVGQNEATGREELRNELGIDVERDIDHVVAYMLPGATPSDKSGLVLAAGHFDQARIGQFILAHGGIEESYKGKPVFTHKSLKGEEGDAVHEKTMAVAFLNQGLVAMGAADALRTALDLERGGENVTANDEMMRVIGTVEDGSVWAVGRFDAIADSTKLPEAVAHQIPPITWFSASGHVNGGVAGRISIEARDEAGAKNLRDVLNGFRALVELQAGSKPEFQAALKSFTLGGEDKTVTLSFTVPIEMFEALHALAGQRSHGEKK
jgi:hypothetical protein